MTTTPPPRSTCTPRVVWIDPRLGAAALKAPAASREDSRTQAILKVHRSISLKLVLLGVALSLESHPMSIFLPHYHFL